MNKSHFISFCLVILLSTRLTGFYNSNTHFYSELSDSLQSADSTNHSAQIKNNEEIKFLYPRINQHITYGKIPIVWKSSSLEKPAGRSWNIQWSPDFGQTWVNIDSVSITDNIYEWQINNFTFPPEHIRLRLINKKNRNESIQSEIINFDAGSNGIKAFSNTLQDISFAIGANFSFLDGTKVNGLYLGLNTYLPKIWSTCFLNFGLDILLEQGVSTIKDTNIKDDSRTETKSETKNETKLENTIENKRVVLSSSILTSFGKINNLQLALNLEARQCNNQIQSKSSQTVKDQDQTKTTTSTVVFSETNMLFFWGGGIIYREKISDFDTKFSFLIFSNIIEDRKPYFIARFNLMETISSIKFGTEIRGPFFDWHEKSPHEIFFFIAKEISIRDLFRTFF